MIHATVTGNVGKDPEMKETKSGKKMCIFSVASSQKRGDDQETTWIDCVVFEELAEAVAGDLNKGMRVIVQGNLSMEKYKKRDGSEGSSLRMLVNDVGLMIRPKARAAKNTAKEEEPW